MILSRLTKKKRVFVHVGISMWGILFRLANLCVNGGGSVSTVIKKVGHFILFGNNSMADFVLGKFILYSINQEMKREKVMIVYETKGPWLQYDEKLDTKHLGSIIYFCRILKYDYELDDTTQELWRHWGIEYTLSRILFVNITVIMFWLYS